MHVQTGCDVASFSLQGSIDTCFTLGERVLRLAAHRRAVATCVVDRNCSLGLEHRAYNMALKKNEDYVIDLPPIVHATQSVAPSGSSLDHDSESPMTVTRGLTFGEGSGGMPITIQVTICWIMLSWCTVNTYRTLTA